MSEFCEHIEANLGMCGLTYEDSKRIAPCKICMEDRMNRAKKTAQKRRALLRHAATCSPTSKNERESFLGKWALKIWNQGIGFHKRAAIEATAKKAEVVHG